MPPLFSEEETENALADVVDDASAPATETGTPKQEEAEVAEAEEGDEPSQKRLRPSTPLVNPSDAALEVSDDQAAEDWLCPLTRELPFDPVIAEGGCLYERCAIEAYQAVQRAAKVECLSPVNSLPMGARLMANAHARNTIDKLVRSGKIGGARAERWLEKKADEELVNADRARALQGDTEAMWRLGVWSKYGGRGVPIDVPAAFAWFKRGGDLGQPSCLWKAGAMLIAAHGCPKNRTHGMLLVGQAAEKGSAGAIRYLADCYLAGTHGLPRDVLQAKAWLERCVLSARVGPALGRPTVPLLPPRPARLDRLTSATVADLNATDLAQAAQIAAQLGGPQPDASTSGAGASGAGASGAGASGA
eukprot:1088683-Prymnesium_polylepis.1